MMEKIRGFIAANGRAAFVQAVSGGQHRHADGLFYGGEAATWSRSTLTQIVQTRLSRARCVAFIDYHSGLGPRGYGELITMEPDGSAGLRRAKAWYGARVITIARSVSALISGDWLSAMPRLLPDADVTGVAIEFGTVDVFSVLLALVGDNWLHTRGMATADDAMRGDISAAMRAVFFCDDDLWRGMVVGQSLVACRQALNGLQG
jgi:hypothetical protein